MRKVVQIEVLDDGYLVSVVAIDGTYSVGKRRVALTEEGAGYVAARLLKEEEGK